MSIARTHHTQDYTCMSNRHFKDTRLSLKAKGLLSLMLSLPDEWDYSVKGLAMLSSDGETAVRSAVKELENAQYLKRTMIKENGKIVDWEYDIFEFPLVENPQVEIPLLENKDNKVYINKTRKNKIKNVSKETQSQPLVKNKNFYQKCLDEIQTFDFTAELEKLVRDYLSLRLAMTDKKLYTVKQWRAILIKLTQELAPDDVNEQIAIVKQSIERGYASFFPVNSSKSVKKKTFDSELSCAQYTYDEEKQVRRWQKEQEAKGERIKY